MPISTIETEVREKLVRNLIADIAAGKTDASEAHLIIDVLGMSGNRFDIAHATDLIHMLEVSITPAEHAELEADLAATIATLATPAPVPEAPFVWKDDLPVPYLPAEPRRRSFSELLRDWMPS